MNATINEHNKLAGELLFMARWHLNDTEDLNLEIQSLKTKSDSLIPLGFLYTQYPLNLSPIELWPNMSWLEVTNKFANLFFRAEGPETEPFGTMQLANQSWISNIITGGYKPTSFDNYRVEVENYPLNDRLGHWTKLFKNQAFFDRIEFFTTDSEVRPKNTAIKIWKRIK